MNLHRLDQVRRGLTALASGAALTLPLHARVASACSCFPSTVESSYQASSDVIAATPLLGYRTASERRYLAHVTRVFKGCSTPGELVLLTTPASSAACGAELELGTEYLLNAQGAGSFFGAPKLAFTLCGYNLPASRLSGAERAFLDGRTVCCGDACGCADGSEPVLCFADPCDVTPACEEATRCEANYCGGCNAEFYDDGGRAVCQPAPAGECGSDAECVQTGCSGQLCAAEPRFTSCEFREEYACFQDPAITSCGCLNGQCAFAPTPELAACQLEASGD